jgi:hypothetical protein
MAWRALVAARRCSSALDRVIPRRPQDMPMRQRVNSERSNEFTSRRRPNPAPSPDQRTQRRPVRPQAKGRKNHQRLCRETRPLLAMRPRACRPLQMRSLKRGRARWRARAWPRKGGRGLDGKTRQVRGKISRTWLWRISPAVKAGARYRGMRQARLDEMRRVAVRRAGPIRRYRTLATAIRPRQNGACLAYAPVNAPSPV